MKLFGVGFCASLLGVGITNTLMGVRQMLDPSFMPLNPPQVRAWLGWAGGWLGLPHIHPLCRRSNRWVLHMIPTVSHLLSHAPLAPHTTAPHCLPPN